MTPSTLAAYLCATPGCAHAFYRHRDSAEWQRLNPRRKRALVGCTAEGCPCTAATVHLPAAPTVMHHPNYRGTVLVKPADVADYRSAGWAEPAATATTLPTPATPPAPRSTRPTVPPASWLYLATRYCELVTAPRPTDSKTAHARLLGATEMLDRLGYASTPAAVWVALKEAHDATSGQPGVLDAMVAHLTASELA